MGSNIQKYKNVDVEIQALNIEKGLVQNVYKSEDKNNLRYFPEH